MPRRQPEAPVFIASAAQVRLTEEVAGDLSRGAQRIGMALPWQRDAWGWRDALGEVWFASTWYGNALAQVGWLPATGEDFRPARDEKGVVLAELDNAAVLAAEDAMARLTGVVGGQGEWARQVGELWTVPAEAWLAGYHVDEKDRPVEGRAKTPAGMVDNVEAVREVWEAYSPTELTRKDLGTGQGVEVSVKRSSLSDKPAKLPSDTILIRMWKADPRFPDDPTGPMKALGPTCELLDLFGKAMKGTLLGRTHAGILAFDASAVEKLTSQRVLGPDGNPLPGAPANELINELVQGLSTPRGDPNSASWIVPTVLSLKLKEAQDVAGAWDWKFPDQSDDAAMVERVELLIKRLATGLDVPPEVLLGMSDANHWTAWQISEDAFRQHVRPTCVAVADCLTIGYLWPAMREAGVSVEDCLPIRVGFSADRLISHPNRSADADAAFDRGAISYQAYRRYKRFDEDDAPPPGELETRSALGFTRKQSTGPAAQENVQPGTPSTATPSAQRVVRAAARPAVSDLGRRCAAIEQAHLRDTLMVAEDAVNEALRLAGARLKNRARRNQSLRVLVDGVDARLVAATLGPRRVYQLTEEEGDGGLDSLFAGAFSLMLAKYREITSAAQVAWRRLIWRTSGIDFTPADLERMNMDAIASEAVLEAAVRAVVSARLLDPAAHTVSGGEKQAGISIPSHVARRASARAGGSQVSGSPDRMAQWEGGVASGQTSRDLAAERGLVQEGVEWVYGTALRDEPFEPHVDLDGQEFSGPDDPGLDSCPWGSCVPGDHAGCLCTWAISYSIVEAAA